MLFRHPFLTILALLAVPTQVLSRKGGDSSSSDSDSDSSSSGSGSSGSSDYGDSGDTSSSTTSSSGGPRCSDTHRLDFDDLQPSHYYQYNRAPRRGHAGAYSDWDGVFFKGEANLKYTIITPPNNLTEGDIVSSSLITCPVGKQSLRMLGAAWVGAKAPTPVGPVNPFTLGFKAWESNIRVSDIDYSYSVCENLDLIRLTTTVDWYSGGSVEKAMDAVALNITQAADNSDKILFDGAYDLKDLADSERNSLEPAEYDNSGLRDQMISLPDGLCSEGRRLGKILIGWPTGTHINGSMTNETLELNFSGSTVAGFERGFAVTDTDTKVNVTFELTFTGSFDAANSSQVVLPGELSHNASLISFERATGSATVTSLSLYYVLLSLLVSFGMMVL
ncbi:unnamed protein product [Penicillium nalgiovense]|uniref:Peptidase A1 domain-containing protein n=1 Tax=Penicillium nalgiovense TaxID=60175 RepID=A0A1V6YQC8_PENNA|nr:hypothetical protein PENNAL_c0014G01512 [Penicillium nalgiovense]CAG7992433.1 unnamed protein product [Penicillium nalgiovense]CAG8015761.1 unnamed protein product [Penicillium nalgiovense]CAG8030042.1 unnamed protein product [Penicillium nalgiovense]CAG8030555.1 unnamed protein product [Penicillium nalgiovense]